MSKKNKSGDPRKGSINNSNKYFSCWEYRENVNSDYKIILSVCNEKMKFRFPYENIFGYRDMENKFFFYDDSIEKTIELRMFGLFTLERIINQIDYIGFSYLFGGEINGQVSPNWIDNGTIKLWKGGEITLSPFFGQGNLRKDLETFCQITDC